MEVKELSVEFKAKSQAERNFKLRHTVAVRVSFQQ